MRPRPIECATLAIAAGLLSIAIPGEAQERAKRAPDTDRTVTVTRGARLTVNNDAGEVVIRSWDRDSLRVQARHGARVTIDIQNNANVVSLRARASGPPNSVDYDITAPAWLPVKVSGQFVYIGIEGVQNEVSAETVSGDIVIKGGSGTVTAKSIHGEIIVNDTKGRITLNSVNEDIRVTGASGELAVETTNGNIVLEQIDAKSVEVGTVNGDVRYEGTIAAGGPYRFATHNGNITMVVPETTNATFTVRTYQGDFNSNLPTKVVGEVRRGRRATYTIGNGGSEVELESFGGSIRLRRPGTVAPVRPRGRRGNHSALSATSGSTLAARTAGAAAASDADAASNDAIVEKLHGSHGAIPKSIPDSSWPTTSEATPPTSTPPIASDNARPTTMRTSSALLAPSATLMPISRVRCPTRYDITP
jgi:hypothetical protein